MENIDFVNLGLIPAVSAVVSAIKVTGMHKKWTPIVSMIVGILGVMAFDGFSGVNVVIGVVTGLAASGLYSGTKTMILK